MRKTTILKIKTNVDKIQRLGMVVTGLYNVANYERRQAWSDTGKIPNYYQQYYSLRDHELARLLHSHVAQQVLKTLEQNYKSWFALRKNGHADARPPRFKKKGKPSTFHFTNYGFKIINNNEIQVSTKSMFGENMVIRIASNPSIKISELEAPKILQFVFKKGKVTANLVHEINDDMKEQNGNELAIDLGIKNFAVTYDTFQTTRIYKGGQILSTAYYFDKKIARLQAKLPKNQDGKTQKYSKLIGKLHHKKNARIKQVLHSYTNHVRDHCIQKDIRTVIVGDLTNLRKHKDYGKKTNLKIHSWRYDQFTAMLHYKLAEKGIRLEKISEKYTSRTCPTCGNRKRSNRFTRGNYKCSKCGYKNHSDVIGAMNILTRYQSGDLTPNCNSRVNSGYVVKFSSETLTCTEAPQFIGG